VIHHNTFYNGFQALLKARKPLKKVNSIRFFAFHLSSRNVMLVTQILY